MTWQMNVDPLGNIGLSALVAAIPILFLFWALAIKRMKGHFAAMGGTGLAVLIAVLVFGVLDRHHGTLHLQHVGQDRAIRSHQEFAGFDFR